MSLSMYINFNGNCRDAVQFYSKVFNQPEPYFLTYKEGNTTVDKNVKMTKEMEESIMHTSLHIGGTEVFFSDMPSNFNFSRGNSMSIAVFYENVDEAKKIFNSLSKDGKIFVPLHLLPNKTYYGLVVDKFDISWTIQV